MQKFPIHVSLRTAKHNSTCILNIFLQEPITRSVQLPYSVRETAFSQVGLFLDKPFPRISSQKPIRSDRLIINKLLMRNYQ